MGRKKKERSLTMVLDQICKRFGPIDDVATECLLLRPDEVQALRYKDIDGYSIIQAAEKMGISKSVFGSLYKEAREKLITAVLDGKEIAILCPLKQ